MAARGTGGGSAWRHDAETKTEIAVHQDGAAYKWQSVTRDTTFGALCREGEKAAGLPPGALFCRRYKGAGHTSGQIYADTELLWGYRPAGYEYELVRKEDSDEKHRLVVALTEATRVATDANARVRELRDKLVALTRER